MQQHFFVVLGRQLGFQNGTKPTNRFRLLANGVPSALFQPAKITLVWGGWVSRWDTITGQTAADKTARSFSSAKGFSALFIL